MAEKKFTVEVEKQREEQDGRPSRGPVFCTLTSKDGRSSLDAEIETCWDVFRTSVHNYPNNPMLGHREIVSGKAGRYTWLTYQEVYGLVLKIGNGIRHCGVAKGGRCGIYGANCPEWVISMEACNAHGIYCVPLYDTLGVGAIEFIISHSEVSIVFVEARKLSEVLKTLQSTAKFVKTIVSFGNVTSDTRQEVETFGISVYAWDEFLELGRTEEFDLPRKDKSEICTIMYTSGTTGDPKGVLLTNQNIIALLRGADLLLESVNEALHEKDVYLSYLPLAHIFDRVIEELFIRHGASIGFWRGDVKLLVEDIGELRPSVFCAVPRVLERIYSGLIQKISSGGILRSAVFKLAYSLKLSSLQNGSKTMEAAPLIDRLVFSRVKQGLGGNVRLILSGAAPLAVHVEKYLRVVSGAHVLQGYGLTETCAGTCISLPNQMQMIGTVGPPLPTVEVCLESVPEMEYDALSLTTPRGEVCVRGDTVFSGYYKREDLTEEVMVDGWFHTGDIGEWQANGSLKIIDRKKNIFKLSQGEYVAVENLENIYGLACDIDSIWVYGNSFESFLIAVVNPNKDGMEKWASENGVVGDLVSICKDPKAKEYIMGELMRVAKEKKLKGFEVVKDVHLDPFPFDMDRDLLTPTYKKKRPQLLKYYQNYVDIMYKSQKNTRQ